MMQDGGRMLCSNALAPIQLVFSDEAFVVRQQDLAAQLRDVLVTSSSIS